MSETHTHEDIKSHVRKYMYVFASLMVLTIVTVGVSYLHLPLALAIFLALAIASTSIASSGPSGSQPMSTTWTMRNVADKPFARPAACVMACPACGLSSTATKMREYMLSPLIGQDRFASWSHAFPHSGGA